MTTYQMTLRTPVATHVAEVWAEISTMAGVNRELWPVVMSAPRDAQIDAKTPLGTVAFRSALTIGHVLPMDLHWLRLMKVEPGTGFAEASWSLSEKRWEHRRDLIPTDNGCEIIDDLTFEPRVAAPVIKALVSRIFRRRHRYLATRYRACSDTSFHLQTLS